MILVENTYYHISKIEDVDAFIYQCKVQFEYEEKKDTRDAILRYMKTEYFRPKKNKICVSYCNPRECVEFVPDCDVDFV